MLTVLKRYLLELGSILIFTFTFAFISNFIWESFHAVYLYEKHDIEASLYIPMIVYVSTIDGMLIVGLYLLVGIVLRNMLWAKEFNTLQRLLYASIGILTAGFIEYYAVYLNHKWAYKAGMPMIFGIGLSPMIQLSTTGILCLWLTREVLYGKGLIGREKR